MRHSTDVNTSPYLIKKINHEIVSCIVGCGSVIDQNTISVPDTSCKELYWL